MLNKDFVIWLGGILLVLVLSSIQEFSLVSIYDVNRCTRHCLSFWVSNIKQRTKRNRQKCKIKGNTGSS